MSYAIRNDGKGWRAVKSVEDVLSDETFVTEQPVTQFDVELERPEVVADPVAKLVAFLQANPDVMALLK